MGYKYWVLIAVGLFVIGLGIGLVISAIMPDSVISLFSEEMSALEELAAVFGPFQVSTAVLIFFKNASALLLSFIFSPILCLLPVLALLVNGSLISFVSVFVAQEESIGLVLAGLLPHGIFEIPAIIIGEAAALSFGAMVVILFIRHGWPLLTSFIRKGGIRILLILALFTIVGIFLTIILLALSNEQTRPIFMGNLKQNLKYLMIAFVLLVPAAIIETFVTPLFLQ